jgi:hypothetical protein
MADPAIDNGDAVDNAAEADVIPDGDDGRLLETVCCRLCQKGMQINHERDADKCGYKCLRPMKDHLNRHLVTILQHAEEMVYLTDIPGKESRPC